MVPYVRIVHTTPAGLDPDIAFEPLPVRRARCADGAGTLAPLFFSDDDMDIARAKAVCSSCALREECLQNAIARREAYGVWGGVLLIDGEPTRFARRRGRPARDRIEIAAEEVPIPAHLVA
ncbi:putative WhiB family transcriptional regulator [Ilumatobacter coccineus YM16-304]|uniref:Transcriptional regulator WhiB n=1 Tax=Ilumatobacter coccineus (strain NBRC 103263 / KCTC 29153 / YM16-304) TaxID=1313172 RepID=A0A6C7E7V6_ILUCY|nr:putative WhiB family transcriptional regulator [Ilumatobacter coccineus YM16-304]